MAVELVARFRQLTASHIGRLVFADTASQTPRDRCLRRLIDQGYLSRLDTRLVGGSTGGSTQFVYQLGRRGWQELRLSGRYWAARSVNAHALEIADLYVALKAFEREGEVAVLRFDIEQESWRDVAGVRLTPDAFAELGNPAQHTKSLHFIEVDRGTEHWDKLLGKCVRYWRAYNSWSEAVFPSVLFLTPDARRQRTIERVIAEGPRDAASLFRVVERHRAAALLVDP